MRAKEGVGSACWKAGAEGSGKPAEAGLEVVSRGRSPKHDFVLALSGSRAAILVRG